MSPFAFYLLKVFVCSGILVFYYLIALKDKAFHQWNRFYLLSAVALSIVLPLVQIIVVATAEKSAAIQLIQVVQSADDYLEAITVSSRPYISTEQWIMTGYAFASLLFLIAAVLSLVKLRRLAKKWGVQEVGGIRFINTADPRTPFSFWRSIFWNCEIPLHSEAGRQIFQHELVHIKEKHTLDALFLQAVMVVFWCNPFFWLIKKELRFIHEFIADKQSVGKAGTAAFATMILQAAYPSQYSSLVNPFFQKSIKRRLLMLTKMQNPKRKYMSRLLFLPLLAFSVFAFSVRAKNNGEKNTAKLIEAIKDLSVGQNAKKITNVITDTIPRKQIESVDVNKPKDRITVYYTDGSCETMTEQEANNRRLINNGGYGTLQRATPQNYSAKADIQPRGLQAKPLLVVNGDIAKYELLSAIDPSKVKLVNVLKGPAAIVKYGSQGENGVIEVTTKTETDQNGIILQADSMTMQLDSVNVKWRKDGGLNGSATIREIQPSTRQLVFEQTETPASVDKNEWLVFIDKVWTPAIRELSRKLPSGTYEGRYKFVVETNGKISHVALLNKLGYDIEAKIAEIMERSPKWKPAIQNGLPVASYRTENFSFTVHKN